GAGDEGLVVRIEGGQAPGMPLVLCQMVVSWDRAPPVGVDRTVGAADPGLLHLARADRPAEIPYPAPPSSAAPDETSMSELRTRTIYRIAPGGERFPVEITLDEKNQVVKTVDPSRSDPVSVEAYNKATG